MKLLNNDNDNNWSYKFSMKKRPEKDSKDSYHIKLTNSDFFEVYLHWLKVSKNGFNAISGPMTTIGIECACVRACAISAFALAGTAVGGCSWTLAYFFLAVCYWLYNELILWHGNFEVSEVIFWQSW